MTSTTGLIKPPTRPCSKCSGTGRELDPFGLGKWLSGQRVSAGLTIRALAGKVGLSAPYVCDLEHGRRGWSLALVYRFVTIFGFVDIKQSTTIETPDEPSDELCGEDRCSAYRDELECEVARLREEVSSLSTKRKRLRLELGKIVGNVALYGFWRFPLILKSYQLETILSNADKIREFIKDNEHKLRRQA